MDFKIQQSPHLTNKKLQFFEETSIESIIYTKAKQAKTRRKHRVSSSDGFWLRTFILSGSCLRWDNFNETVKRVEKEDEVLWRYYDEVVAMEENPLPPLRKCQVPLPRTHRGNCTVFVEPATHYYDGPDPERWKRKQNEKEFMRQIAAIGKYPLGRMSTWRGGRVLQKHRESE